jgi:PAS domain S-box-containing protein
VRASSRDDPGGVSVPVRVLVLGSQPADADTIARELARAGLEPEWRRVDDEADFLAALETGPDLVVADVSPALDARAALRLLGERGLDVPLIVLARRPDAAQAVDCLRAGVADYLAADRLACLGPAATRALEERRRRAEAHRAHAALQESERRFRRLADHAPDLIYWYRLAPEPGFEYVNQAATAITGYPPEDFYADPTLLSRLVHPEDQSRLAAWTRDPAGWGGPLVLRCVGKDGRTRWTEHRGTPVVDDDGLLVAIEGIVRDVTDRKEAEVALRDSEERFRSAFEGVGTGMAFQTLDGRYLRVNAALCQMLGYPAEAFLGQPFHAFTHPDDRRLDAEQDRRIIAGEGDSYQVERRYLHRSGALVWALCTVSVVRSPEGRPLYFAVQAQDVTERKRAAETQARLQAQLVQSEKVAAMGQLLAGVAHELNNPLSVVLGQTALLRQKAEGTPLEARAAKIARAAERCARIVKNFLALARQRPPAREPVALNRVVEEALELLTYGLHVDDVDVGLDLASDLPTLSADPHQLHQVIINLVTNAHQALRQTPPPRRLRLSTRHGPAPRTVALEVTDNGPGIPEEILDRIFEPFFTTKPAGQGTGLGLPLCQGIVEEHGGAIRVRSAPGRGTTFEVELPATLPALIPAPPAPAATPPVRGRRILVVDDEPEIRALLQEILGQDAHLVETAATGTEGLARIAEQRYALVLSDLKMPGLDGPALYRAAVRLDPALRRRFVFLTGDSLYQETRAFLAETPAPCMTKPFSTEEALQVVRHALQAQTEAARG